MGSVKRKILDDLTQLEFTLSFGGQQLSVSVFLIDGLLIDTGPSKKKEELVSLLKDYDINEVILTHHHEDHTGAAHLIQEDKKIPIYICESGIKNCEARMKLPLYRKVFWGEREPFQPQPLGNTHKSPSYTWDVIHTPGHAHDHIALYNREKQWLFGGDLYVQSMPKSSFAFESIPIIIQSLRTMLTYDFEVYICSHAGIIQNGRRAIERKLNYLVEIEQEVLSLHKDGMSRREIRKELFPKRHAMNYLSLFENSPQHIVNSILK